MLRKTLTILSLIGLLLSVGLWGASYFHVEINLPFAADPILLSGACVYWSSEYVASCDRGDDREVMGPPQPNSWIEIHAFEGFRTQWWTGRWPWPLSPIREIYVPLWMPCLVFATLPTYSVSPLCRRRKRKKLGLCVKCGYNLRASKERCPEMG